MCPHFTTEDAEVQTTGPENTGPQAPAVSQIQMEAASVCRMRLVEGLIRLDSDFDQLGEASDDCVKSSLASRRKTSLRVVAG